MRQRTQPWNLPAPRSFRNPLALGSSPEVAYMWVPATCSSSPPFTATAAWSCWDRAGSSLSDSTNFSVELLGGDIKCAPQVPLGHSNRKPSKQIRTRSSQSITASNRERREAASVARRPQCQWDLDGWSGGLRIGARKVTVAARWRILPGAAPISRRN